MIQIEHNRIKNPTWLEAALVGYLQAWPRIWTQDDREQSSEWLERESNPGPPDCESDALTTRHSASSILHSSAMDFFSSLAQRFIFNTTNFSPMPMS